MKSWPPDGAKASLRSADDLAGIVRREMLLSSRIRRAGMLPCVNNDAVRPFYPQAREHVVDFLGARVIHVLGHACSEDPGANNDNGSKPPAA